MSGGSRSRRLRGLAGDRRRSRTRARQASTNGIRDERAFAPLEDSFDPATNLAASSQPRAPRDGTPRGSSSRRMHRRGARRRRTRAVAPRLVDADDRAARSRMAICVESEASTARFSSSPRRIVRAARERAIAPAITPRRIEAREQAATTTRARRIAAARASRSPLRPRPEESRVANRPTSRRCRLLTRLCPPGRPTTNASAARSRCPDIA